MKRAISTASFLALACSEAGAFVLSNHASLRRQSQSEGTGKAVNKSGRGLNPGMNESNNRDVHKDDKTEDHNFALRMKRHQETESDDDFVHDETNEEKTHSHHDMDGEHLHERRMFLGAMLSSAPALGALSELSLPQPANAIVRNFPDELSQDDNDSVDLAAVRGEIIAVRKASKKKSMDQLISNPAVFQSPNDYLGSIVWAVALWLLSGSRSNPIVTPLGNAIYDEEKEPWLKDRNVGLFAPLPAGFLLLMGLVFILFGVITDRAIVFLAEGDSSATLQLAGVALIGGGALELGRIAGGEKGETREENERATLLGNEFNEFAGKRLKRGGNCHRSEVVGAFRRYFAKYRYENEEYPLSDLEIERLIREWNREEGNDSMSSAGFFTGLQINDQADAFGNR